MGSARTVTWTLSNATTKDWRLDKAATELSSGVWTSMPPDELHKDRAITFKVESNGAATGAVGVVVYKADGDKLVFEFHNPYWGADWHMNQVPDWADDDTDDKAGNDYVLDTRISEKKHNEERDARLKQAKRA